MTARAFATLAIVVALAATASARPVPPDGLPLGFISGDATIEAQTSLAPGFANRRLGGWTIGIAGQTRPSLEMLYIGCSQANQHFSRARLVYHGPRGDEVLNEGELLPGGIRFEPAAASRMGAFSVYCDIHTGAEVGGSSFSLSINDIRVLSEDRISVLRIDDFHVSNGSSPYHRITQQPGILIETEANWQFDRPVEPGSTDVVMAGMRVTSTVAGIRLNALTLQQTAGRTPDIAAVRLVHDRNADQQPADGEPDVATGTYNEAGLLQMVSGGPDGLIALETGTPIVLLLVCDFVPGARVNVAHSFDVVDADVDAEAEFGLGMPAPFRSAVVTIRSGLNPALRVQVDRADRTAIAGERTVVAVIWLEAVGAATTVDRLELAAIGDGNEPVDVTGVQAWADANRNNVLDGMNTPGGDRALTNLIPFLADDGSLSLPLNEGAGLAIPAGGQIGLLVTYTFQAGVEGMFALQLTGLETDTDPELLDPLPQRSGATTATLPAAEDDTEDANDEPIAPADDDLEDPALIATNLGAGCNATGNAGNAIPALIVPLIVSVALWRRRRG